MITSLMALTAGELSVKITDVQTPIIIPFAPRYFGKTCLLHRLIHYIRNNYVVNLDVFFLPPHIAHNSDIMAEYTNSLCSTYSPCATSIPIFGSFFSSLGKRYDKIEGKMISDTQNSKLCFFDDGIVVLSIGYNIEEENYASLIYQSKKLIKQMDEDAYNDI